MVGGMRVWLVEWRVESIDLMVSDSESFSIGGSNKFESIHNALMFGLLRQNDYLNYTDPTY